MKLKYLLACSMLLLTTHTFADILQELAGKKINITWYLSPDTYKENYQLNFDREILDGVLRGSCQNHPNISIECCQENGLPFVLAFYDFKDLAPIQTFKLFSKEAFTLLHLKRGLDFPFTIGHDYKKINCAIDFGSGGELAEDPQFIKLELINQNPSGAASIIDPGIMNITTRSSNQYCLEVALNQLNLAKIQVSPIYGKYILQVK